MRSSTTSQYTVQVISSSGSGAGFYIADPTRDGEWLLITNNHVIGQEESPRTVLLWDDPIDTTRFGGDTDRARLLWRDPVADLAILHSKSIPSHFDSGRRRPKLASARTGELVIAFGYPAPNQLGLETCDHVWYQHKCQRRVAETGIVDRPCHKHRSQPFCVIEFDGDVEPGYSGGPLINQEGDVVGVVFDRVLEPVPTARALDATYIRESILAMRHNAGCC